MSLSRKPRKQAGIPPVPPSLPADQRQFFQAIRENLAVRMGQEGDPLERAVVLRDFLEGGGLGGSLMGSGGGGTTGGFPIVRPSAPELDYSVPPAPTGVETSGGFNFIYLVWDNTAGYYPAYAEVYRSTEDALDLASAEMKLVGLSQGTQYVDYLDGEQTVYYYWVRFVKIVGNQLVYGAFNQTAGTPGQLSLDPSYIVGLLEGQLGESELAAELLTPIQQIPTLAGEVATQAQTLQQIDVALDDVTGSVQTKADAQVVTNLQGEVTGIKARYSIKLDVNGRMSGMIFGDNGTESSLVVASNSMLFIDPGQSITPFNPAINYSSMEALRDTQLVFGYARVEGQNRFVINAPAYIPEGYITSGQVGAIGFGKITDSNGEPVTTVAGKLKAENIDVDNVRVAVAATFDGTAQSGDYSAGGSGWGLFQSGYFEAQNAWVRGRIEADTGYIASTLQIGGTSQNIGDVVQMAQDAAAGNSLFESWVKPGYTLIDGNKIFTGDAYVDTLQIKGQAVTFPRGVQAGNSVTPSGNVLGIYIAATGAPLIITGCVNITDAGATTSAYGSRIEASLYRGGTLIIGPVAVATAVPTGTNNQGAISYSLIGGGSIQAYIPTGVSGSYYLRLASVGFGASPRATTRSLTVLEAKR